MAVNYYGKRFYNIGPELKIYMVTNANYAIAYFSGATMTNRKKINHTFLTHLVNDA
jgi:hypothetical protein